MKKFCFLCLVSFGWGALPPLPQSVREIQALLQDPRLYELLGSGESIQKIIRNDEGYLLITTHFAMQVDLKYERRGDGRAGPVPFIFEFHLPAIE